MAEDNVARRILWPGSNVLLRIAFLYVGQGASALLFAGDGEKFKVLLVDINMGRKNGGIDVPRLVKDVLGEQSLTAFVNTPPTRRSRLWRRYFSGYGQSRGDLAFGPCPKQEIRRMLRDVESGHRESEEGWRKRDGT